MSFNSVSSREWRHMQRAPAAMAARPKADFSLYAEIDTTWVLRDHDFNFVWPSPEAVYATGMGDIYSSILAMRSKASRIFLSPRQFLMDRKKEGAQEYLGDILY